MIKQPGLFKIGPPSSFGIKIFLWLSACIVAAVIVLNITLYTLGEKRLRDDLDLHGEGLAELFADNIHLAVFTGSTEMLQNPLNALLKRDEITAACVFNVKGGLLLSGAKEGVNKSEQLQKCNEVLAGGQQQAVIMDSSITVSYGTPVFIDLNVDDSGDELFFENGFQFTRERVGYVVLSLSKKRLLAEREAFFIQSIGICFSFLVFILLVVFFVVSVTTRPLRNLLFRIKKNIQLRDNDETEIEIIGNTFDSLLVELEESFNLVTELKDNLEIEVSNRTEDLRESNASLQKTLQNLQLTQMQLVHSEKMASLGLLSTGLAHEINNALTIIKGSVTPLEKLITTMQSSLPTGDGKEGNGQQGTKDNLKRLLHHLDIGVDRINELVRDLLIFSRQDNGAKKLIDINKELDASLELLKTINNKNIVFKKEYTRLEPFASCSSQLNQVFFNILLNGVQAIEEEGIIKLSTGVSHERVIIEIADSGCGIPQQLLPKIFDPFFTTKEIGEGTGLGLGICHGIVTEYGGTIEVESSLGKGTIVTIKLPLYEENGLAELR